MRGLLTIGIALWASAAWANPAWDELWQTSDQRGQALLGKGQAAEAATVFRDPRRKAYAELQAGNYAQAAKDFSAFDDSDGHYNRGNALARAGQLQAALQAYDAALSRDPGNHDAKHNRDLVAKALAQQPPPQSGASGDQQKQDGNGGKGTSAGKDKSSSASSSEQKKGGEDANKSAKGDQHQDTGSGQDNKADQDKSTQGNEKQAAANERARNENAKSKDAKNGSKQEDAAQRRAAPEQKGQDQTAQADSAPPSSGQPVAADSAAEARQDAEAALGKSPQTTAAPLVDSPVSERQLARQQWLRRIPDDPGGLLRRKFLIEHMLRQQGEQP
jgi:Ca-activated chloride channel homolog